jgi:hypothetical protein
VIVQTKADIAKEALSRITGLQKGCPVTNICAGISNPRRLSFFVGLVVKQRKNKYGILLTERWARCTDKEGNFWNTGIEVIYPGHIDYDECCKMFAPIHALLIA